MKKNLNYFEIKILFSLFLVGLLNLNFLIGQSETTLIPEKDNTIIEKNDGSLSNGSGQFIFAGRTGQAAEGIRRAVIKFDLVSGLPGDAVIDSVALILNLAGASDIDPHDLSLFRVLKDWGEGTSDANGGEGAGALAQTGDVTWVHTMYDTAYWQKLGGDFVSNSSATTTVTNDSIAFVWTDSAMVNDLNFWFANPDSNFGWIIIGEEDSSGTARKFFSKNNSNPDVLPGLFISYTSSDGIGNDLEGISMEVFPNPATDVINLKWKSENFVKPMIRLADGLGREVLLRQSLDLNNVGEEIISISDLSSGIYFLSLIIEGKSMTRKILVD